MCNYVEQPMENKDSIIIPGSKDRKSNVVAVHDYIITDVEFDLAFSGKKTYIIEFGSITHVVGDILNFIEYSNMLDKTTGRALAAIVTYIDKIIGESTYIISYKPIT